MEVVNCQLGNTKFVFLFLFFLCTCLTWSCEKEESITLTFTEQQSIQDHAISKIQFVDDNRAYALGGNQYLFGIAQFSSDQGKTWSIDTIGAKTILDFDFDQDEIYSAGFRGYYYSTDTMSNTWQVARPGQNRYNIRGIVRQNQTFTTVGAVSRDEGYIRQLDTNFTLLSEQLTPGFMNNIVKTGDGTFHAVGFGQIYRSLDDGVTWLQSEQVGDNYQDVFFISNETGWIVGESGSILRTTDGGISWSELRKSKAHGKDNLLKVHFTDEDRGVVVGEEGVVWSTTDGGDSWAVVENLPNYNYTAVHMRDDVAWLGSEQGVILRVFF